MTTPPDRKLLRTRILLVAAVGAVLNVILAAAKVVVGLWTHSQALVADGVHSLSDLVTDAAVLVGARYWTAPADRLHPYGHGRLETIVNVFIGAVLAATALGIGWRGMTTMGAESSLGWPALLVAAGSVFTKEALFRWTARSGRRVGSSALVANAWHHRSDALSSVPVLVAVLLHWLWPSLKYVDNVAAIAVAALLLKAAWDIVRPALSELMESQDTKLAAAVHDAVEASSQVHAVYDVRARRLGGAVFVELKMIVDPDMSVAALHRVQHQLEADVRERFPAVVEVLAHGEPGVGKSPVGSESWREPLT